MNKKIFFSLIVVLFSIGSLNAFASDLYIKQNGTPVFTDTNKNYSYLFWEGYKVEDTGEMQENFRKVVLSDGKQAFINDNNLTPSLDSVYMLQSDSAKLLAEKFPLFVEPNAKGNVKKILYKGSELSILNRNLINKVWVRVKDSNGEIGYIWYKTLHFSNNLDNAKKSLSLGNKQQTNNILNQDFLYGKIEIQGKNNTSSFNSPFEIQKTEKNYDIEYEIIKVKNKDYAIYLNFLDKLVDLQKTDPGAYKSVLLKLKTDSPSTYYDILRKNKQNQSNSILDDQENQFLDGFFGTKTDTSTKNEVEKLENLDTDEFLKELFK